VTAVSSAAPPAAPEQSGAQPSVAPRTKKPKHPQPPPTSVTNNQPSAGPTDTALATDTAVPTHAPSDLPSAAPTAAATLATLDYSSPAIYGDVNDTGSLSPDPFSIGMTTGGQVKASTVDPSCVGFASSARDLTINVGGGAATLLRIYFVASSGDASLIVNDPFGFYSCVDDSFGTFNPTIDFTTAADGEYDVWVGSSSPNSTVTGKLYLTGNSGNHP
jgi:hypothetical protein